MVDKKDQNLTLPEKEYRETIKSMTELLKKMGLESVPREEGGEEDV